MSNIDALIEENIRLREGCRIAREALAVAYGHPEGELAPLVQEQPSLAWMGERERAERSIGKRMIKFFR